jgi:hypothetical protein
MPRGRPSRYSEELHQRIVEEVRAGRPKTIAFRLAGAYPDTVWDWVRLGRQRPDDYPHYVQLGEDIDQAKAEAEAEALDRIKAAAQSDPKHWTAAAWYLERTNPAEFGRRERVEVEASAPLIQLNQVVLSDPEVRDQARALLRHVTALRPAQPLELEAADEDEA